MNDTPLPTFDKAVRTSMVIHGALLSGVLTFLGVVLFMVKTGRFVPRDHEDLRLLSYIAAGVGAAMAVLAMSLPTKVDTMFRRNAGGDMSRKTPFSTLDKFWIARTVISSALLEGAALLNIVAYQLGGRLLNILVVGAMVLLMAVMFPTQDRARQWKERQERQN